MLATLPRFNECLTATVAAKIVVALAVVIYLHDSEGLSDRNVALLEHVASLRRILSLPLLVGCDFTGVGVQR